MRTYLFRNRFFLALAMGVGLLFGDAALAALRAETTVPIFNGHIRSNSVLSDDEGKVFIEVLKDTYAFKTSIGQFYDGYLLAPEILPAPEDALMPRMDEIVTFELYTMDNIPVVFADKKKQAMRGVKVLVSLINPGNPALWEYDTEKKIWRRLGGRVLEDAEGSPSAFVAYIHETGIYGVFDEEPRLGGYGIDPALDVEQTGDDVYSSQPVVDPEDELAQLLARMKEVRESLEARDAILAEEGSSDEGSLEIPFVYEYEEEETAGTDVDALLDGELGALEGDTEQDSEVDGALLDEVDAALDEAGLGVEEPFVEPVVVSDDAVSEGEESDMVVDEESSEASVGADEVDGAVVEEEVGSEKAPQEEGEDNETEDVQGSAEGEEGGVHSSAPNIPGSLPQSGSETLLWVFLLVCGLLAGFEAYERWRSRL